jgi:hypothetical protein
MSDGSTYGDGHSGGGPHLPDRPRRIWAGLSLAWKVIVGLSVVVGLIAGGLALWNQLQQNNAQATAQAKDLSAAFEPGPSGNMNALLDNSSSQPVYRVVVRTVGIDDAGNQIPDPNPSTDALGQLPPGRWWDFNVQDPGAAMGGIRPGVELAFTDASGRYWLLSATGHLTSLSEAPEQYFHLPLPIPWNTPSRSAS